MQINNRKRFLIFIIILVIILIACISALIYLNSLVMKEDKSLKADITEFGDYNNGDYYSFTQEEHIVHDEQGHEFINNELGFDVKLDTPKETVENLAKQYNAVISSYIAPCIYSFRFNKNYTYDELITLKEKFETLDFINGVDEIDLTHLKLYPSVIPNDVKWDSWDEEKPSGNNWGLEAIRAPSAWEYIDNIKSVNVGVFDTMFAIEHEDLQFANYPPKNPLLDDLTDQHGTHVTGTIAATFNNKKGICGVSPKNNIYGITISAVSDNQYGLARALIYLIKDEHCKVINFSVNPDEITFAASRDNTNALNIIKRESRKIEEVLNYLIDEGHEFVICQAAGNQWETDINTTFKDYRYRIDQNAEYGYTQDDNGTECGNVDAKYNPLSYIQNEKVKSRIIVVGAVQNEGNNQYSLANFSQRGKRVDVTAPGVDIYSTSIMDFLGRKYNYYENLEGTSMATPHVSGLASMVFGINPQLTGKQVKDIICDTANKDKFNLIDAGKAVKMAKTLGSIHGTVQDKETRKPLKATIKIYSSEKLFKTDECSPDTGKFSVFLPAGTYDIVVTKNGYKEEKVTISLKEKQMYIIDEPFELQSKESLLKELLLSSYWENNIQSPKLYKFNEDNSVDEYDFDSSSGNNVNAIFNKSLHYKIQNDTLIISDWETKLKYVTLDDKFNWDEGLRLNEKISDNEFFFYETTYSPTTSSDNAMYLQKSNRSITLEKKVEHSGEDIEDIIVGTWKDFDTPTWAAHQFTFYNNMTYIVTTVAHNTEIEHGTYKIINSSTIYLYQPGVGALPLVVRYHIDKGVLEPYVDKYFYKID